MSLRKVKWGILSTANIGVKKVVPSMQNSELCEMVAISSRNLEQAQLAAEELEIPTFYGSYEQLLADPNIDAIYNPLPNHLHVPWTLKAMEAGKHVLCEKPISITSKEAELLLDATQKYPKIKVMEAFMYRFHPQWEKVKKIIKCGDIGEIRCIDSVFTYHNVDPNNVRNKADIGGGGILDIGCYCINLARFLYESEPIEVHSFLDIDPDFKTDRLASGTLQFEKGIATFLCSTQLNHKQSATIYGTKGRIELNIPFNAPNEHTRKIKIYIGNNSETILFDMCDQYSLQGDAFSRSILDDSEPPISLSDSFANMHVIDRILTHHK